MLGGIDFKNLIDMPWEVWEEAGNWIMVFQVLGKLSKHCNILPLPCGFKQGKQAAYCSATETPF